jgi:hypothetical protein
LGPHGKKKPNISVDAAKPDGSYGDKTQLLPLRPLRDIVNERYETLADHVESKDVAVSTGRRDTGGNHRPARS